MRISTIFFLLLGLIVVFEYWRLSAPATLRTRVTYDLQTPSGPKSISTVVEERRTGAILYLPGGERGVYRLIGDAAMVQQQGFTLFLSGQPLSWLRAAAREGRLTPPLNLPADQLGMDKHAPALFREFTKSQTQTSFAMSDLDANDSSIRVYLLLDGQELDSLRAMTLREFETAHPGYRLARVSVSVTSDPVSRIVYERYKDAKMPSSPFTPLPSLSDLLNYKR